MYLRHTVRRKGGKEHTYWQLVRSVRRGDKVAQEVVAHLGELDAQGRVRARQLAARITRRSHAGPAVRTAATVACAGGMRTDQVRVERARSFGGVWLGWILWPSLGM